MKTKLLRFMFALFAVMVGTSVNAQTSGTCGYPTETDVTWSYDNGTLTFTGTGAMNMYNENQPDAPWWMNYMTDVTSVVVGEGITTIPHLGFAMFENLSSVTLPSTLTTIGKAALEECAFTTIDLPEGLTTIGDYAFQMGKLTTVTIPSTVTYIGEVAFQAMETLTSVTFLNTDPTTITFGENIFQACDNLTAINVPAGKVDAYKAALPDYAALIVEGGAPTPATSGSCGTNATWSYSNGIMTIGGSGAMTDYSSSMTDIPWIAYQESISRVVIGDEITHVGDWAFQGCTALNSVTIGENVTSIGNGSFDNCTNDGFTVLTIPNSVQTIGIDAFSNNHLKYVCFGSGLTSIGMEAFMVCQDLEAIGVYASTPPTLGMGAFMACSKLATIYVPSAKITDYKNASGWSDYAAMIKSPGGECGTNATWTFEMATGVLTIEGTGAITDNTGWDSTYDNDSRAFNPFNAEWYPYGIKSVVIEEGITEIPASAFYMEIGITEVTLPSTLTAIGMDAFGECENIETITCNAVTPPTLADTGDESYVFYSNDFTDPNNPVIIPIATITAINVPAASVDAYKAAAGWSDYADKIVAQGGGAATTTTFAYTASEKLTVFDDIANFTGATAVKSHEFAGGTGTVVYDGTVTAIADYTFRYDNAAKTGMTSITLPASLTTTGEYTFWYCGALESVAFDGTPSLTTIGKSAFKECTALTAIAIPASVTSIGVSAFSGCTALASVTFTGTSSLTHINQSAFSGCTSLTSITLPESLTTLGTVQTDPEVYYNGSVFWNSGITSLNIPKNVSTIYGVGYFAGCNMTSLTVDAENATYADLGSNAIFEKATNKLVVGCNASSVPSGVTTIGFEAFWAIQEPFSLTLPATVTTIEARAFHLASGLTAINIPAGVTAIEDETFSGCSLTTLVIPNTVTKIGGMAFDSCNELTSLTLGSEVTTIGGGAFSGCNKLTALEIPAKVTALEGAFSSGNLATITVAAGNTKYDSRNDCNAIIDSETNTMLLGCKNTTFPDGVTKIGGGAFRSCLGLTTLNIPATVTEIGESAFAYCSNITELTIPSSISVISSYAFQGCKKLTTVNIPDGVTTIEGSAFSGCSGLTTVTLGSGLTSIAQRSFYGCTAVTDVYCYADPENLTWNSAGLYWGYDFKEDKATLCHVADADAWPSTSSSDKFYKVNVTFVGDLVPMRPATHAVEKGGVTANWSTYYNSTQDVVADANTEVYQVSLTGKALTLTKVDDRIINAGQGVVLKSTDANIVLLTSDTQSATSYATNSLTGTDTQISNPGNAYVLGYDNSILGFYKLSAGGTIKAHKAYLTYAGSGAPEFFDLEGNVTGITNTNLSNQTNTNGAVYTLDGRRVGSTLKKGLYIVNGKTVIIK